MSNLNSELSSPAYRTLDEIRLRKAQLLTDITKDSNKIRTLWDDIFHPKKDKATPTSRFANTMKMGAGIVDGLILGWKLYRKLGGGKYRKNRFWGIF